MLSLFLVASLCGALKLSDPASLRDVNEDHENMSLQSWCVGTGCVMPFTPASCLSWCDWNVDKQADAEARGAFGDDSWYKSGKLQKATSYKAIFAKNDGGNCENAKTYDLYFRHIVAIGGTPEKAIADSAPIFPGGDEEKLSGDTELKCNTCYIVGGDKAAEAPVVQRFGVFFTQSADGVASKLMVFTFADQAANCAGVVAYHVDLPAFTAGKVATSGSAKGEWVGTGGACAVRLFVDTANTIKHCGASLVRGKGKKCNADGWTGDSVAGGESVADHKARITCCSNAPGLGKTKMGFGLSHNLAWPAKCKSL